MTSINVKATVSARERLLSAADELFYQFGIASVGIDRIAQHAGVAKGSLYYNFGSKEELVRCYLENRRLKWAARVEQVIEAQLSPREKLLSVFDTLGDLHAEPGYNGCTFTAASGEHLEESGNEVISAFRIWLKELFIRLSADVGLARPELFARRLGLLYDGANVSAQLHGDRLAARSAKHMAEVLLNEQMARGEAESCDNR